MSQAVLARRSLTERYEAEFPNSRQLYEEAQPLFPNGVGPNQKRGRSSFQLFKMSYVLCPRPFQGQFSRGCHTSFQTTRTGASASLGMSIFYTSQVLFVAPTAPSVTKSLG